MNSKKLTQDKQDLATKIVQEVVYLSARCETT
jgi:hypothetical protein